MAVEDVVTQGQRACIATDEFRTDVEGLCQSVGAGLGGIAKRNAEIRSIAERALELLPVFGRGNDQDVANTS